MTGASATKDLGWLIVFVASWAIPLTIDGVHGLSYFTSLLFWALPIGYLLPFFLVETRAPTTRRRRALASAIGLVVGLGILLDFLLGHYTLAFDCDSGRYIACLPAVGGRIPIEELLFYASGPLAIVLVYAVADEYWLHAYSRQTRRLHISADLPLIQVTQPLLLLFAALAALGVWFWVVVERVPVYYCFLVVAALLPAIFLYRVVREFVNWPAFALTVLYVVGTSLVWEVTLAIPRQWWNYNPDGMLGVTVGAWSTPVSIFPIEAAFVWLCAPFTCILSYEFAKAFTYHPASTARRALRGAAGAGGQPRSSKM